MSKLEGAVIAVTGGARGIGLATAEALARRGALVHIGDLDGTLAPRRPIASGSRRATLSTSPSAPPSPPSSTRCGLRTVRSTRSSTTPA